MKLITNKRNSNGFTNKEFSEYLKKPITDVSITQSEIEELKSTLEKALDIYSGYGISANQLGIKKRICLIDLKMFDYKVFLINPRITEKSEEMFLSYESCLSIPKSLTKPIPVVRHAKITIETDNMGQLVFEIDRSSDKEKKYISLETLQTAVVQHEIDHLDGITIQDRQYNSTQTKPHTYGRNDKIVMKSPSGQMVEVKYKKANEYFVKGYEII